MLTDVYEATFEDARGPETTQIHNDGAELRVSLRGVDFVGSDFDGLSPIETHLERARALFTLQHDCLCSCRLQWVMPLAIEYRGEIGTALLAATLDLGDPTPNGGISSEVLALELRTPVGTTRSSGHSGWFEDEMLELEKALAGAAHIRSCITCAYADYSPCGHGLFGSLACFRGVKDEYLRVSDKAGIFAIWQRLTEFVQETYLCEQFRRRVPGSGYRG
ncbi:MAG: hypothetical protein HOW73_16015 [Polyangiaceae bacterium]|nr:hypothetical protein [Polyangiaceae bacterium]